jgi:hypothetical protein
MKKYKMVPYTEKEYFENGMNTTVWAFDYDNTRIVTELELNIFFANTNMSIQKHSLYSGSFLTFSNGYCRFFIVNEENWKRVKNQNKL